MLNAELTASELASIVEVDAKSVGRRLAEDRVPYPVTGSRWPGFLPNPRLGLWPTLLEAPTLADIAAAELQQIWPTRTAVTSDIWHTLFSRATKELDILVYAGGFLLESLDLADILRWKASTGTRIRVLIGDADSPAVHARAEEVDLPWLPERCRTTARYLTGIGLSNGFCVATHATTLYASQFRFDDTLLVDAHSFGVWACESAVYRLRKVRGGHLYDFYADAFERVWSSTF